SQVGSEPPVRRSSAHGVTVDASGRLEDASAGGRRSVLHCGLPLRTNPPVEIVGRIDEHALQHLGVLEATILCALAEKYARPSRIHPQMVHAIRDEIGLSSELRNPEAVIRVG